MNSVADVWDNVLQQLKKELSETTIATWFDELEAVDIQGNVFILHCSNDFKKGYIESLFMKNVQDPHLKLRGEDVVEGGLDVFHEQCFDIALFEVVGAMEQKCIALDVHRLQFVKPGGNGGLRKLPL